MQKQIIQLYAPLSCRLAHRKTAPPYGVHASIASCQIQGFIPRAKPQAFTHKTLPPSILVMFVQHSNFFFQAVNYLSNPHISRSIHSTDFNLNILYSYNMVKSTRTFSLFLLSTPLQTTLQSCPFRILSIFIPNKVI